MVGGMLLVCRWVSVWVAALWVWLVCVSSLVMRLVGIVLVDLVRVSVTCGRLLRRPNVGCLVGRLVVTAVVVALW